MLSVIVSQGLDNCELIVINDGSDDQTENICQLYAKTHKSIKVISISNSGVSVARNTGLQMATGKYIYFLDSDDTLSPGALSFFRETVVAHPSVDIFAFGYEANRDGKLEKKYVYRKYSGYCFNDSIDFLDLFFQKKICCHVCSLLISRNLLKKSGIVFTPSLRIGEDIEFIIKILSSKVQIHYDARLCFIYQIRNDSTMQGYKTYSKEIYNSFVIWKKIVMKTIEKHMDILPSANFFLANNFCSQLYRYLKSDFTNGDVSREFISNRKILFLKKRGNLFVHLIILIIRSVPIKLLYRIFGKNNDGNIC